MSDEEASAANQLAEIDRARHAVTARAAKEYLPYFGWGIFALVMFPPFDFLNPDLWGPITGVLATAIGIFTVLYFYRRTRKIRVADVYPWWVWPAWTAFSNGLLVGSFFLRDRLPFASTLAGLLAAIPMLVIGVKLLRRHRAR